jgi:hypothetical protein
MAPRKNLIIIIIITRSRFKSAQLANVTGTLLLGSVRPIPFNRFIIIIIAQPFRTVSVVYERSYPILKKLIPVVINSR